MERIKSYIAARERSDSELVTYRQVTPLNFLGPTSLQRRTSVAINMASAEDARQFYSDLAPDDQVLIKTMCVDADDPVEAFVERIEGQPSHRALPVLSENCTPDLIDAFKRSLIEGSADSIQQEDPDLYERGSTVLEAEYRGVVKKYFDMGIVPNHYVLNMHSYLYREFGVALYHIWFKDKLKNLYAHDDPKVQSLLSQTLNPGGHLNRNELNSERYSVADVDIKDLAKMSQSEIDAFCKQRFRYSAPPASRTRVRIDQVIELVKFMQQHDLDVVASPSMVQDWRWNFTRKMTGMRKRIEFIDSIKYLPRKLRQVLIAGSVSVESIQRKIEMFENAGIHPVQYGPYLSSSLTPTLANLVICDIIGAVALELRREKFGVPNQESPERIIQATIDRIAGVYYLDSIGINFDTNGLAKYNYTPERGAILYRLYIENGLDADIVSPAVVNTISAAEKDVKKRLRANKRSILAADELDDFFDQRGLTCPVWLRNRSTDETILNTILFIESHGIEFEGDSYWSWLNLGPKELQRKIDKEVKLRKDATEFDNFVRDKNLDLPPWYEDTIGAKAGLMRAIRKIEKEYGVEFTGQWSWINSKRYSRRGIEEAWRRANRHKYFDDLIFLYNLSEEDLPSNYTTHEATTIWRKIRIYEEAGIPITKSLVRNVSSRSDGNVRHDAFRRAIKLKPTEKSSGFISRYVLAQHLEREHGWENAFELTPLLTNEEFNNFDDYDLDSNYRYLHDLYLRRQGIFDMLIQARASFVDMMYFLDDVDFEELERRLVAFIDRDLRVDVPMLYRNSDEIERELDMVLT